MRRFAAISAALISALGVTVTLPAASATAGDPVRGAAATAVGHRPAPVSRLRAYDAGGDILLQWANPARPFRKVAVRYRRGSMAPQRLSQGSVGRLRHGKSTSTTLRHLVPGADYSVSVWTRGKGQALSLRRTTRFTTPSAGEAPGSGLVRGVVTDDQDHPLGNVLVYVYATTTGSNYLTTTDASGRYRLRLPAATYVGGVWGPDATGGDSDATGYQVRWLKVHVQQGKAITANRALIPGGRISGRVTDTEGNPLGGVELYILHTPYLAFPVNVDGENALFDQIWDTEPGTPSDGRYSIGGVPRGTFVICYDTGDDQVTGGTNASGYADNCQPQPIAVTPRASVELPDMALVGTPGGGGAIVGTVTDPSGRPVGDADLYVQPVGKRFATAETLSQQDGSYQFAGLAPGDYRICVLMDVATSPASGVGGSSGCRRGAVEVTAGAVTTANIKLRPAAGVDGTVRGPNGRPVRNASVTIARSKWETDYVAQTDSHGHFSARTITPGRWRICFDTTGSRVPGLSSGAAPGCVAHGHPIRLTRGEVRLGVDATLGHGAAVQIRTFDAAGHAIPGTDVDLMSDDPASFVWADQSTDRSGQTTFTGLPAGGFDVCATTQPKGNESANSCTHRPIHVKAGHTVLRTLTFPVADNSVSVTVTDGQGHPVSGANAVLLQPCAGRSWRCTRMPVFDKDAKVRVVGTGITAGHGQFQFDALRSGSYAVCVMGYWAATSANDAPTGYSDGCTGDSFDITINGGHVTPVAMSLAHAGAISGTVTDDQGRPIRDAIVKVSGAAANDSNANGVVLWFGAEFPLYASLSGPDGTFTVRSIAPGSQRVCVRPLHAIGASPGGYLARCLPDKEPVEADSATGDVTVQLSEAGAITGTVSDDNGKALHWADVGLFQNGKFQKQMLTKRDGSYTFDRLTPDDYVVCFLNRGDVPECYDDVPYPNYRTSPPPKAATLVTTSAGVATEVDASLTPRR